MLFEIAETLTCLFYAWALLMWLKCRYLKRSGEESSRWHWRWELLVLIKPEMKGQCGKLWSDLRSVKTLAIHSSCRRANSQFELKTWAVDANTIPLRNAAWTVTRREPNSQPFDCKFTLSPLRLIVANVREITLPSSPNSHGLKPTSAALTQVIICFSGLEHESYRRRTTLLEFRS